MPTSDPKHYLPVLQKSLWFNGLPAAAAQDLLSEATVLHLGAGQQLFLRGDSFDGIYCVLEGGLRVTGIAPNGQENLFSVISPPTWFGEIAFFDGLPRTHDALAVGPTVLLRVSPARLHELVRTDPQWSFRLAVLMAQKTRLLFFALEAIARLDTQARLARVIAMTVTQGGTAIPDLVGRISPLNQGSLAETLGVTRQTVAAGLKVLQDQGIVSLSYRRVTVTDWPRLCEMAKIDAEYPPPSRQRDDTPANEGVAQNMLHRKPGDC